MPYVIIKYPHQLDGIRDGADLFIQFPRELRELFRLIEAVHIVEEEGLRMVVELHEVRGR